VRLVGVGKLMSDSQRITEWNITTNTSAPLRNVWVIVTGLSSWNCVLYEYNI